jgi:hypothetical protein
LLAGYAHLCISSANVLVPTTRLVINVVAFDECVCHRQFVFDPADPDVLVVSCCGPIARTRRFGGGLGLGTADAFPKPCGGMLLFLGCMRGSSRNPRGERFARPTLGGRWTGPVRLSYSQSPVAHTLRTGRAT